MNLLTVTTLELYATEQRGMGFGFTVSLGMLGGVCLPFFNSLSTELLIIVILVFITGTISVFFVRETKQEEHLRHLSCDLFPEEGMSQLDHLPVRGENCLF